MGGSSIGPLKSTGGVLRHCVFLALCTVTGPGSWAGQMGCCRANYYSGDADAVFGDAFVRGVFDVRAEACTFMKACVCLDHKEGSCRPAALGGMKVGNGCVCVSFMCILHAMDSHATDCYFC